MSHNSPRKLPQKQTGKKEEIDPERSLGSDEVTGQQEVGDPLAHGVFVAAGGAHELALDHLRLEKEPVQVLERLGVCPQGLGRRWCCGQGWEAELFGIST